MIWAAKKKNHMFKLYNRKGSFNYLLVEIQCNSSKLLNQFVFILRNWRTLKMVEWIKNNAQFIT